MTIKPGDTVADATTLPVGAVFKHTNNEYGPRKGLRRPAPTAQPTEKRPPCDACGEESCRSTYGADVSTEHALGEPLHLCQRHWKSSSREVVDDVRARRAKTSSGSGERRDVAASPHPRPVVSPEPAPPRWPNTSPDRIPAHEVTLAAQVAAGGVDTEYTRGRLVAREVALRELDRPSRPMSERYLMPGGFQKIKGAFGGIRPGPLLHRSELPLEQKALWRRR